MEAPEDDDFGDFEGAEDEAPEAVQAMIGGPNWVYPGWFLFIHIFFNVKIINFSYRSCKNTIDEQQYSKRYEQS